jgi:branched-chain amino acid transport system substrate-binding protein
VTLHEHAATRRRTRQAVWIFLALIATVWPAVAQENWTVSDDAEELFLSGVGQYQAGKYLEAVATFDRVIREYPRSQRETAAVIMKGKAYFLAAQYLEAGRTMREFLVTYPTSTYRPDAQLVLGRIYHRIGRPEDAFNELLQAWRATERLGPEKLRDQIIAALDSATETSASPLTLQRRVESAVTADERAYFWLRIAESAVNKGMITSASVALDTLLSHYPRMPLQERLGAMINKVAERSRVKIAALIPLMQRSDPSAMKEIGNDVYNGIEFAVDQYASDPTHRVRVGLEVRDTERDPVRAGQLVRELARDPEIVGIVGPVFSLSSTSAAETAQVAGIPLMTPTATANAIAAIGPYVFQANPDFSMRGRAMARYAVEARGFARLAVLAPNDSRGRSMADAFIREATALGARVIGTEWYTRGTSDLKSQLRALRHAAMLDAADPLIAFTGKLKHVDLLRLVDLGIPTRRLDSLMARGNKVNATLLLGPQAKARLDSIKFPVVYDEPRLDSLEYPVNAIDGLYAPISGPEEIGVVSSQVVYFHFQTQILGSMEWNNIGELDGNKRYCDAVVFESDSYVDTASTNVSELERSFTARYHKRLSRNALYGYDSARLMLSLIMDGATGRGTLANALQHVTGFQGIHGKIGLFPRRVNSWLSILQFTGDQIHRLEEMNVETQFSP